MNEEAATVRLTDSSLSGFSFSPHVPRKSVGIALYHVVSTLGPRPCTEIDNPSQQASSTKLDMAAAAMDDSQVHKTANLIVCMRVPPYDSVNLPSMCIRMHEWVSTN